MQQTDDNFDFGYQERPKFLKVLCILTFIGSGFTIMQNVVAYFTADTTASTINIVREKTDDSLRNTTQYHDSSHRRRQGPPVFVKQLMRGLKIITPDVIRKSALINLFASGCCLLGALLMWNLKRTGYYLYLLGTVISIILPFYIYGNSFIGVFSAIFPIFFGVLFCVFYAMNFKSLK